MQGARTAKIVALHDGEADLTHEPDRGPKDVGCFDGSSLVDRPAGGAGSRCDSKAPNSITVNVMHEIVSGQKTLEDARKVYAESMAAYTVGSNAPYAERFLFAVTETGTDDPDKSIAREPWSAKPSARLNISLAARTSSFRQRIVLAEPGKFFRKVRARRFVEQS